MLSKSSKPTGNMLDHYRKQASFCSNKLQEFVETKEVVTYKNKLYKVLEDDQLFHKSLNSDTIDEVRRLATMRGMRLVDQNVLMDPEVLSNPLIPVGLVTVMAQYDTTVMFKATFTAGFFGRSIMGLGTTEHSELLSDALGNRVNGCFALTEIAHGSNAKNMRTTATFDINTQEYVLHTEDFEAAKCWVGNLGQFATHGTVFAQLVTPDGKVHGLHAFVVPLRDMNTHKPFPGVIIGDMGEKIGLNGIDNGYCMFNQYRIPKSFLLSKIGSVNEEGQYVSPIKDPRKRFGAALGQLVGGRISVSILALAYFASAITIATRYSAVRRQFGPEDKEELSVIEYQLQQFRLFPHIAALFVMKSFIRFISIRQFELQFMDDPEDADKKADEMLETHALAAAAKAVISWRAVQAIQDSRESCGGHGYLKCAGFGDLKNNNDANCTYEGENNVLQQQASNWLTQVWDKRQSERFSSPLGSVNFFYLNRPNKMSARTEADVCHPPVIMEAYQWLVCWLAEKTVQTNKQHLRMGKDPFTARNDSQIYNAKALSIAYIEKTTNDIGAVKQTLVATRPCVFAPLVAVVLFDAAAATVAQHFLIKCFWDFCNTAEDRGVRTVLTKLCALFALTSMEKQLVYFFQGGYLEGSFHPQLIQSAIISLCQQLKPEAVGLVDAVAPPDFLLMSALGHSNGEAYKNMQQAFAESGGHLQRPSWWTELSPKFRSRL